MNDKKCIKFLLQIYYQSLLNENFFHSIIKTGINFLNWPSNSIFDEAKKFFVTAKGKSYNAAIIENSTAIPDEAYNEIISDEEIKIFYVDYLNYLRALDLLNKLKFKPENAVEYCNDFLENKTSITNKINLSQAVGDFVINNEKKIKEGNSNVYLSAFPCLSKTVGGFNPGRITIMTAHTGFGKTNFGVNFLKATISSNKKSLYINMEMDTVDMTKRFLQSFLGIRNNEFERPDYIQKLNKIDDKNLELSKNWITDGSSMSVSDICQMISEIKRKQELDFVIVDYDQKIIMDDYGIKDEWQSIRKAVEKLESIAKKESVHILMFAQTNEESDGAPIASKRSMQPASSVIQFTKDENSSFLKFIKNRHGSTSEKIKLIYDPALSLIIEDGYKSEVLPPPPVRGFNKGNIYV